MSDTTTILYAEDDPNDVFFMERAFAKAGAPARLLVVPDGQKAVDYVLGRDEFGDRDRHPPPAFILLDLKMPILTGIEALREIRAHPATRETPVVLLTSSTHERDIGDAQALGANGYFVKPSNATELIRLLKAFTSLVLGSDQPPGGRLPIEGNRL